jgi:hypothetical protein
LNSKVSFIKTVTVGRCQDEHFTATGRNSPKLDTGHSEQ